MWHADGRYRVSHKQMYAFIQSILKNEEKRKRNRNSRDLSNKSARTQEGRRDSKAIIPTSMTTTLSTNYTIINYTAVDDWKRSGCLLSDSDDSLTQAFFILFLSFFFVFRHITIARNARTHTFARVLVIPENAIRCNHPWHFSISFLNWCRQVYVSLLSLHALRVNVLRHTMAFLFRSCCCRCCCSRES